jgi:hypothetical protein
MTEGLNDIFDSTRRLFGWSGVWRVVARDSPWALHMSGNNPCDGGSDAIQNSIQFFYERASRTNHESSR